MQFGKSRKGLKQWLKGLPVLVMWDFKSDDGNILRLFFEQKLELPRGDQRDIRAALSKIDGVLHVEFQPNYWSIRWSGENSVPLRVKATDLLAQRLGWTGDYQKAEIDESEYWKSVAPRARWKLRPGD